MKTVLSHQIVDIPEDVHSKVTVEGPRGTLWRDFKHIRGELSLLAKIKKRSHVDKWLGNKELAPTGTICSSSEPNQGCYVGFLLQDNTCVILLRHQHRYSGEGSRSLSPVALSGSEAPRHFRPRLGSATGPPPPRHGGALGSEARRLALRAPRPPRPSPVLPPAPHPSVPALS
ncbi:hypothetical protein ACRRTK_009589 [Alexandromys fortis]